MNKKIIIKNLALATIITLNMTGCSLVKDNSYSNSKNEVSISTEIENNYEKKLIYFSQFLENSNLGIDMTNFYDNTKTLKIIVDNSNKAVYSSYNIDTNIIKVANDGGGSLEHELLHLTFADRKNDKRGIISKNNKGKALDEGIVELLNCELFNKKNTYNFEYGVAKIIVQLLGKEKIIGALNKHDVEILINGLAEIVPEYKDANELIEYYDYAHTLSTKMHNEYFKNGNIDNFKSTSDYTKLKNVRSDLIKRFKIYIKNYYKNRIIKEDINPKNEIIDMIALLDTVDNNLFDPDIEINKGNDFFLKNEITQLINKYHITNQEYDECVKKAKDKNYFINQDIQKKNVK